MAWNPPHETDTDPFTGCLVCGKPLVYAQASTLRYCAVCGRAFTANTACQAGHYVCDACHMTGLPAFAALVRASDEKDPVRLFLQVAALPGVHMHGPEHHAIIICTLLAAFYNNGGAIDLDDALQTAIQRGNQVPGGACGYQGVCGAATGAATYASIVTGSHPLNAGAWGLPMLLAARCLERLGRVGGPRCCKRTVRICIEEAAEFTGEHLGVSMPISRPPCTHNIYNLECLQTLCPYYAKANFRYFV